MINIILLIYFNPHPHEEGDHFQRNVVSFGNISIHTLTKRVTRTHKKMHLLFSISIHTLTKRVTLFRLIPSDSACAYFNPHPHEEGDLGLFKTSKLSHNFNPHPHEEGDNLICRNISSFNISIHTLTKRVTAKSNNKS